MDILSEAEINLQLQQINTAISKLINGEVLTELRVGSGSYQRNYRYQEINLEDLKNYRKDLLNMLHAITDELPSFRSNATIPLIVTKRRSGI